ncbi:urease subunit gamma [Streptomyces lydicamycinicus]|nr:urease subunit gamma [Streptomyces lydicamycinicus]URZ99629.1 urease subunit gamma [Streptomyces lydicamycinicus]
MIETVQVEATFSEGTKLVTIREKVSSLSRMTRSSVQR